MKKNSDRRPSEVSAASSAAMCLTCGLCCDGTLFGSVELQLADDAEELRQLGLPVTRRGKPRFSQPCRALGADCHCGVYSERPQQCRAFECALLQSVTAGRTDASTAGRIIRRARSQADRIRQSLRALGEVEEHHPLAQRFRRLRNRFEAGGLDGTADRESMIDELASLTLAVHELQFLLRREFYPDPTDLATQPPS